MSVFHIPSEVFSGTIKLKSEILDLRFLETPGGRKLKEKPALIHEKLHRNKRMKEKLRFSVWPAGGRLYPQLKLRPSPT